MTAQSTSTTTFSTSEVARIAGVSVATLKRWLRAGNVREPGRNHVRARRFTDDNLREILLFKNRRIALSHDPLVSRGPSHT